MSLFSHTQLQICVMEMHWHDLAQISTLKDVVMTIWKILYILIIAVLCQVGKGHI
jgi:hypothetical protein